MALEVSTGLEGITVSYGIPHAIVGSLLAMIGRTRLMSCRETGACHCYGVYQLLDREG